jgi:hypothetical protein
MEIFSEGGVQVVDTAPLAQLDPDAGTTDLHVWGWRRALKKAHAGAAWHGPLLELVHGPGVTHGWGLWVEHFEPGADETSVDRLATCWTAIEVEQKIADHMAEHAEPITRSIHHLRWREFHHADGSKTVFSFTVDTVGDWRCKDCGIDVIDEYYFVSDDLWDRATYPDMDGKLCIGCLEGRIGRRLVRADFRNDPNGTESRTERFIDRLSTT